MQSYKTIDEYICIFPENIQTVLKELRKLIQKEVPKGTEESISYGMPTFKHNGKYVVYFAGFKKHISIYPILSDMNKDIPEIVHYKKGRGTLQFPLDKDIPWPMIRKVVQILVKENQERTPPKKR